MNKPLPKILCPKCNKFQTWNKQVECTSVGCNHQFSNWEVASQLSKPSFMRKDINREPAEALFALVRARRR